MKSTWLVFLVAALAGSALGFAPAPLPKRQPREPADPIEAGFAKMLAAIRAGRDERVRFTIPVGQLWKTPPFPRDVAAMEFSTASRRGIRFTGKSRGPGPWEVTGLGEDVATLVFHFRDERRFRITVVITFVPPKEQ
jgi:hypothetical protein